jgi:hypothetical protein
MILQVIMNVDNSMLQLEKSANKINMLENVIVATILKKNK